MSTTPAGSSVTPPYPRDGSRLDQLIWHEHFRELYADERREMCELHRAARAAMTEHTNQETP